MAKWYPKWSSPKGMNPLRIATARSRQGWNAVITTAGPRLRRLEVAHQVLIVITEGGNPTRLGEWEVFEEAEGQAETPVPIAGEGTPIAIIQRVTTRPVESKLVEETFMFISVAETADGSATL